MNNKVATSRATGTESARATDTPASTDQIVAHSSSVYEVPFVAATSSPDSADSFFSLSMRLRIRELPTRCGWSILGSRKLRQTRK